MEKSKFLNYIGKTVKIEIDRKMGSKHPVASFYYPVNYGFVPGVISGDGEELDAYLLGVFEPVSEFEGEVIAMIHRLDEDDDKLIVVPKGKQYTDEQIKAITEFQERRHISEILR
jgi:inorganic pyrophosphatase